MKNKIKLTESKLNDIIKRVLNEQENGSDVNSYNEEFKYLKDELKYVINDLEDIAVRFGDLSNEIFDVVENTESSDDMAELEDIAGECSYFYETIDEFISKI